MRLTELGIDAGHVLTTTDLVKGEHVYSAATGITDGDLLRGVRYHAGGATTQSLVVRSRSGTVRTIDANHRPTKVRDYTPHLTGTRNPAHNGQH